MSLEEINKGEYNVLIGTYHTWINEVEAMYFSNLSSPTRKKLSNNYWNYIDINNMEHKEKIDNYANKKNNE